MLYKWVYKRIIVSQYISNIITKDVKLRMHLTNFLLYVFFNILQIYYFNITKVLSNVKTKYIKRNVLILRDSKIFTFL